MKYVFVTFCLCLASCTSSTTEPKYSDAELNKAVANAELAGLHNDLVLWNMLLDQQISNNSINNHIANSIIGHILVVKATNVEPDTLLGLSLETICMVSTDEVQDIMRSYGQAEVGVLAINYVSSIRSEVFAQIRLAQEITRGTGCSLAP